MAHDRTLTARRILLAKATSALALATGLAIGGTGAVHAQAFEGTPTVVSGGVGINRTPGTDNIRVDTNQAVINWTTNDTAIGGGVINFLPNGRTAFFRNNPTIQNQFTVLNRIIPTDPSRAIAMNGTIISQLQTGAGLVQGGNVWFYSPGGIGDQLCTDRCRCPDTADAAEQLCRDGVADHPAEWERQCQRQRCLCGGRGSHADLRQRPVRYPGDDRHQWRHCDREHRDRA